MDQKILEKNQKSPAEKNPQKQHGKNSEQQNASYVTSDPKHISTSLSQPGAMVPFHNPNMEVLMQQDSLMPGFPMVQYNFIHNYNGYQTNDINQSPKLHETQAFPQLLLEPLRPLDLEDWKMLAAYIKLDKFIESIESNVKNHGKSSTKLLMDKWWQSRGRSANMAEIKDTLRKMERIDVLDNFTDAREEWENQHN